MKKTKEKTKKRLPTMTVEMPKPTKPDAVANVTLALESLEASVGWGIVRTILDENIQYLEKCILDKIDPVTKEIISDEEAENCRYKRTLNIELRDTPKNYKAQVEKDGFVPKTFDPYFKTKDEIDIQKRSDFNNLNG
jgi:hypothetical protein